jgi:tRNA G18 (ribose-2'-O)-methylase SpoU
MRDLVVIAHDIRSTHNVGSLLRTAEGLGVGHLYFSGYTPFPHLAEGDPRLPHIAAKLDRQIAKTALGAETLVPWSRAEDVLQLIARLKADGYQVIALEQTNHSIQLPDYHPTERVALLLGREVEGVDAAVLAACDQTLEIPMFGQKESFNVVQAAAMALYCLRFS